MATETVTIRTVLSDVEDEARAVVQWHKKDGNWIQGEGWHSGNMPVFTDVDGHLFKYTPEINERIFARVLELERNNRKNRFDGKRGKRPAIPVTPLAIRRVRLKNYPEYQIDEYGAVYEVETGKMVKPRFRNQRHWVQIYSADGKRKERNVYWLMVQAGYVVRNDGRTGEEKPAAAATEGISLND